MAAESAEQRGRAVALPRVDMRLLAGLALVAVSVVGGLTLWSAARTTTAVVVAARDIGSGAVIEPEDLALAEARLEDPTFELTAGSAPEEREEPEPGQVVVRTTFRVTVPPAPE